MNSQIKFFVVSSVLYFCGAQAQLGETLLRPAYNFINLLTGDYLTNNNEQNQQAMYHRPLVIRRAEDSSDVPSYYQSASVCSNVWSYNSDQSGNFGLVTINNPDYNKNVLKIKLSLAARLQSVR